MRQTWTRIVGQPRPLRSNRRSRLNHIGLAVAVTAAPCTVVTATPSAATPTSWSVIPSPGIGTARGTDLNGVACPNPTDCVAVGAYYPGTEKDQIEPLIESWRGTHWSVTPSPSETLGGYLYSIACSGQDNCVAVGFRNFSNGTTNLTETLIETWDGMSWSIQSSPNASSSTNVLRSVACDSPTDCVAVGQYAPDDSSILLTLAEVWNGTRWSVAPSPSPANNTNLLESVACTGQNSCMAVGVAGADQGSIYGVPLAEAWNGTSWSIIPTTRPKASVLDSVGCAAANYCVAVGSYLDGSRVGTLVENWNGGAWSVTPSPNPGEDLAALDGVDCVSPTYCVAAGWERFGQNYYEPLVESWDGTRWSVTPSPGVSGGVELQNFLNALSCFGSTDCVAVGAGGLIEIGTSGAPLDGLYAWGSGEGGRLGNGSTVNQYSPVADLLAPRVTPMAISASLLGSAAYAIGSDRNLYAWGNARLGALGDGKTVNHQSPEAIQLAPGVAPVAISANTGGALAIGSDGKLYTWGTNQFGELGDGGSTTDDLTPTVISLAPGVTAIAIASSNHTSYAIGSNQQLYAWGDNVAGQIGDGTTTNRVTPEVVSLTPGVTPSDIAAGDGDAYAIGSDGNLYAWGDNTYGQLGDGTTTDQLAPERISLAPGVKPTAITAGKANAYAIGSDGNLYAWGAGPLGDGTTMERHTPEVITLAAGVAPIAVASGIGGAYAIGSDGNLYAWGDNNIGDLGDGTANPRLTPEALPGLAAVTSISAGDLAAYAIGEADQPPANAAEVPIAVLLPVLGLALLGGTYAYVYRRRGRVKAI